MWRLQTKIKIFYVVYFFDLYVTVRSWRPISASSYCQYLFLLTIIKDIWGETAKMVSFGEFFVFFGEI